MRIVDDMSAAIGRGDGFLGLATHRADDHGAQVRSPLAQQLADAARRGVHDDHAARRHLVTWCSSTAAVRPLTISDAAVWSLTASGTFTASDAARQRRCA